MPSGNPLRSVSTAAQICCAVMLCACSCSYAAEIPTGTTLEIRLTRSLASFSSKKGDEVEGVVIAPVLRDGQIVIPMGATVKGTVLAVRRVGLGFIHENARLSIDFNKLVLPDGSELKLSSHVAEIDNARESVDQRGHINGIRSTGTIGYRANNFIAGFAMLDPIAYVYVTVASARMLRFSEPEIWFPAGTELSVKLGAPLQLAQAYETVPAIKGSPQEKTDLRSTLRGLPYRTRTVDSNKPSDLTNLVFLGSPGALARAFEAAGWVQSDRLNAISGFLTLRSIAESQRYQSAPMSILLLDEQRPRFTFSKSLDTFSKRHHVRIWLREETWNGMPVLTASSTQDIGIQLSQKNRTFIHTIDTNIDNERAKIADDLIFTGCVEAAELYRRPWIGAGAQNATGEVLRTDGRVAVLQLNECTHPRDPVDLQMSPDKRTTGDVVERGFRQGILITRNDIYRGNLIYQSIEGTKLGVRYFKHKGNAGSGSAKDNPAATSGDIPAEPDDGEAQTPAPSRRDDRGARNPPAPAPIESGAEKRELFELGVEGGWLRFGDTLASTNLSLESRTTDIPSFNLFLQNGLRNGWAIGTSVTLNTFQHFSNEFSFDFQRGGYRLGASFSGFNGQSAFGYQEQTTGFLTNQFGYALLFNFRSREKRVRPYLAVGTAFQLLHITDAPFKSSADVFKVGLRNVGLILAAYDFANNPPLDGGGVFQFGFQYGGGVKYRFSRRWLVRLDYRETLSPQPNFVERSIKIDDPSDSDEYTVYKESNGPSSPLREQRLTAGFSFVF